MDNVQNYPGIKILGLGPGSAGALTLQVWHLLQESTEIWLRTRHHPVVADIPSHVIIHSFDSLYESENDFPSVYSSIVEKIIELGRRPEGVVYAVPGHPFVAEATGFEIIRRARSEGIKTLVIEGLSFLEPTFTAIGIDPFPQTLLIDALELALLHVPPFPPSAPAVIAQLHSRSVASEVKLTLNAIYPDEHPVKLIHAAGTAQEIVESLSLFEIDRSRKIGSLTTLYVPPLGPATSFEAFQEVVARLRAPDGCPWDREQTHLSLRRYMLEEAYETLDALDREDPAAIKEELGDLLLQIYLHSQIASEAGDFNINDVLQMIHQKIVRRHPHVFGDVDLKDSDAVLLNWEKLKAQERQVKSQQASSILDGVALALPALTQAEQYQLRAARVGFEWPNIQGVLAKLDEEMEEVLQATEGERFLEIGDLLFSVVNLARWYKLDPESALRSANARFRQRFAYIEREAHNQGRLVSDLSILEMEALWQKSKT